MNMYELSWGMYEHVWTCGVLGSWGVQLQSYDVSLNMLTPEVVQLESGHNYRCRTKAKVWIA